MYVYYQAAIIVLGGTLENVLDLQVFSWLLIFKVFNIFQVVFSIQYIMVAIMYFVFQELCNDSIFIKKIIWSIWMLDRVDSRRQRITKKPAGIIQQKMMMKWSEIPFGPECNTACSPWMVDGAFFPQLCGLTKWPKGICR